MKQSEYLEIFKKTTDEMYEITKVKNTDYSAKNDNGSAFANFELIESLTKGSISTAEGILVRMTDKISRIANLIDGTENKVLNEKITDTLLDLANYSIILRIYLDNNNLNNV